MPQYQFKLLLGIIPHKREREREIPTQRFDQTPPKNQKVDNDKISPYVPAQSTTNKDEQ